MLFDVEYNFFSKYKLLNKQYQNFTYYSALNLLFRAFLSAADILHTNKKQIPVHQNGQITNEFGQISKIFESLNYFHLQLQTQNQGHRCLWNVQIHQLKGLTLSKKDCGAHNPRIIFAVLPEKLPLMYCIFLGLEKIKWH